MLQITIRTILLCLLLVSTFHASLANRLLGWNISYATLEADSVEISIEALSFCGGIDFVSQSPISTPDMPSTLWMYAQCSSSGVLDSFELDLFAEMEVSPLCAQMMPFLSTCPGNGTWQTGLTGFYKHTYRTVIDTASLPGMGCANIYFTTKALGRASSSTYNGNPLSSVSTRWNRSSADENQAVKWYSTTDLPVFYNGEEVNWDLGGFDPDGDSLVYALDTLRGAWTSSGSSALNYNSSYSPQSPLMSSLSLDQETGRLSFTATTSSGGALGHYAVAIRVEEYDCSSGALKGVVHRDLPVLVYGNAPEPGGPVLMEGLITGGNITDSVTVEMCRFQPVSLDLVFADLDSSGNLSSDSLTLTSNIAAVIPGAGFVTTQGNPDTITLNAEFTDETLPGTFYVTIWASNEECPFERQISMVLRMVLVEPTDLGPDLTICLGDTVELDAHSGDTFLWTVLSGEPIAVGDNFGCGFCKRPWASPSESTTYVVFSNLSAACGNADTITVNVEEPVSVSLQTASGDTAFCASDDLVNLTASPQGGDFQGPGIVDTVTGTFWPLLLGVPLDTSETVTVYYTLSNVCQDEASIDLLIHGMPTAQILTEGPYEDTVTSIQLQAFGSYPQTWGGAVAGNPDTNGLFDPSQFVGPDSIDVWVDVERMGCVSRDSSLIQILSTETGTSELEPYGLTVYPNPAKDMFTVYSSVAGASLKVFDLTGKELMSTQFTDRQRIDVSSWSAGVYLVQIIIDQQVFDRRLIVLD